MPGQLGNTTHGKAPRARLSQPCRQGADGATSAQGRIAGCAHCCCAEARTSLYCSDRPASAPRTPSTRAPLAAPYNERASQLTCFVWTRMSSKLAATANGSRTWTKAAPVHAGSPTIAAALTPETTIVALANGLTGKHANAVSVAKIGESTLPAERGVGVSAGQRPGGPWRPRPSAVRHRGPAEHAAAELDEGGPRPSP